MHSPLVQRLTEELGFPLLSNKTLPGFLADGENSVLFFAGDSNRYPETNDVAVVLPELMNVFRGRLRAGVVESDSEAELQIRYGFNRWPTLVFLRGEQYLGAISKMRDWSDYLTEIEALLAAEPARPPSVGIPVSSSQ